MDSNEIKQACNYIIDALWLAENIESLPNCNNCKAKNECEYCPKVGEMVRVNCWGWEGEDNG